MSVKNRTDIKAGIATNLASGKNPKITAAETRTELTHIIDSSVSLLDDTLDDLVEGITNRHFTATEKTKLAGVSAGATANATDANLRDRTTHTGAQATSTVTGLDAALALRPTSNTTGITGADQVTNIVSLTQAEYDAIGSKSASTLYVIVG